MEKRFNKLVLIFSIVLVLVSLLCLFIGRYPNFGIKFNIETSLEEKIIFDLRLPRIIMALVSGAILATAGHTFQMLFSNPLVEPGFLGVSQGAAFGASLVIVFIGYNTLLLKLSSIFFGILALVLTYMIAKNFKMGGWLLRLVLAGIAISALFTSLLGVLKFVADPTKDLQDITFWTMGGLYNINWFTIITTVPIVLVCLLILFLFRWRINLLSLDDKAASSLGLSPKKERLLLLSVATIGTTVAISVTGLIGWVGLIIPHISRKLLGYNAKYSLPLSMLLGAIFLLLCDTIARSATASEIPIGLLTSFFGSVFFIIMLSKKNSSVKL